MADFMGRTILGSTAVATAAIGRAFWNPEKEVGYSCSENICLCIQLRPQRQR